MILKAWRYVLAAAATVVLGLLSVADGSGLLGQGQPPCTVIVKPGESIQKTIDAANEGAVICLVAGTWKEDLKIEKSLILKGAGREQTQIKGTSTTIVRPVVGVTGSSAIRVTLENLTVSEGSIGIEAVGQAKLALSNIQILRHAVSGLSARDLSQVHLIDSQISDNGAGIFASNSAQVILTNSQVAKNKDNGLVVLDSAQISLTGSHVSDNRVDGLDVWDFARVEIEESVIQGNGRCGISVISHEAHVRGTPNVMRDNGVDLCGFAPARVRKPLVPQTTRLQISVPDDFKSLQEAIDAIAPGGTILVPSGTYEAGLTLWKPMTLRGADWEQTVLKVVRRGPLIPAISIIAEAREVVLEELTVRGGWAGLLIYGHAVLQHLQVSGNESYGLDIRGLAQVEIKNSVIRDNKDELLSINIYARDSAQLKLTQVQVSGSWTGLYAVASAWVSINNSQFFENNRGLVAENSAQVSLLNCQISDNVLGLSATHSSRVNLTNSQVSSNWLNGLEVWGSAQVEVRSSMIAGNGTYPGCQRENWVCSGVQVADSSQTAIIDSKIIHNADWGVGANLKQCGWDIDYFTGVVVFEDMRLDRIAGNNTSGNQKGLGNPGNHPWNRPDIPDGQVCLP